MTYQKPEKTPEFEAAVAHLREVLEKQGLRCSLVYKRRTFGKRGRAEDSSAKRARMTELRGQGLTLQQIGDEFGVTRERVRQLLNGMPRPGKSKSQLARERSALAKSMKQWLWDAGYRKCADCQLWSSDVKTTQRRCRGCNAAYQRKRYQQLIATPEGREKLREQSRRAEEKRRTKRESEVSEVQRRV